MPCEKGTRLSLAPSAISVGACAAAACSTGLQAYILDSSSPVTVAVVATISGVAVAVLSAVASEVSVVTAVAVSLDTAAVKVVAVVLAGNSSSSGISGSIGSCSSVSSNAMLSTHRVLPVVCIVPQHATALLNAVFAQVYWCLLTVLSALACVLYRCV
jgi:hypothetical protein